MKISDLLYKISHWKTWHHHAKYIPIAPVWAWYCLRSGTPWFFTSANPSISFGGFEGEGKKEMYRQLIPGSYPNTIFIDPGQPLIDLFKQIELSGIEYPFIVKPDVGMMGFMFRKIHNAQELALYHDAMTTDYLVQELINYPIEVALFYYRMPNEAAGVISGFLSKERAFITGDGCRNIEKLISACEGKKIKINEMLQKHKSKLHIVLPKNEIYYLSHASNRSQGGTLTGIDHEIDDRLLNVIDKISKYPEVFYYGRYDIMCNSIDELKNGKNFSVLEFNGAGAGTQHIYANDYNLWQASAVILHHWKMLYRISKYNRKLYGGKWSVIDGWKHLVAAKKNLQSLKKMDASFPVF